MTDASTVRIRQVEARPDAASSVLAGSTVRFSKTVHARVGMVSADTSRRRKMAVAQLPGQSALRRAEPISLFHGEHAPAAQPQRLRVLPQASRRPAEEI